MLHDTLYRFWNPYLRPNSRWRTKTQSKRGHFFTIETTPPPHLEQKYYSAMCGLVFKTVYATFTDKKDLQTFSQSLHPGCRVTVKLISNRFVRNSMHTDINYWTQTCLNRQKSKVKMHTKSPSGRFIKPDGRITNLHIDIVEPLPEVNGYHYLLRWPVVVPLRYIYAKWIPKSIFLEWIPIFGCLSIITADRKSQFQSTLYDVFTKLLWIKHITTTEYHPCANGLDGMFSQAT